MEKRTFFERFKIWFGLGALMFGTYCGANMASGAYATNYMISKGGGHMWLLIGMFVIIMAFFCGAELDFARTYKTDNYNTFYLALWGLQDPEKSNKILRFIVSIFYDFYSTIIGIVTVAATISLFANLMNSLFNVPTVWGSVIAVILFTFLSMYGAGFLRKFNTAMTIALSVCIIAILAYVIAIKGDVLGERLGNFAIGADWGTRTVKNHYLFVLSYCGICCSWGGAMSNYCEKVDNKQDAWITGIFIGILVGVLFLLTSLICCPFMPDVAGESAPILTICKTYLPKFMTAVYWAVVMFSVVSTGPTFIFTTSNRFCKVWKSEKVSHRTKLLVIALTFLLLCLAISSVGLIAICQKWYTMLGKLGFYFMGLPIIFSIYRVAKKDKAGKNA